MKYKLILVDDEQFMLDSLCKIIEWDKLGYEICGRFTDGSQAIGYLSENPVDVVLTDIRMPKVDGLKLAEHINNRYPSIKTVIISGYQDFEFARSAIKFNVVHYLLKPTRYNELVQIFSDIKKQLDEKRDNYDELMPLVTKQFFFDLYTGSIQKSESIDRYLDLIGLPRRLKNNPGCIAVLVLENYEEYMSRVWKHGSEGLSTAVQQFISEESGDVSFFLFSQIKDRIQITGVSREEKDLERFKKEMAEYIELKKAEMMAIIGANFRLEELFVYSSMLNFAKTGGDFAAGNPVFKAQGHDVQTEYQNLLLYYINSGNVEAVNNLFNNYYLSFGRLDITVLKNFNLSLLSKFYDIRDNIERDYNGDFESCKDIESLRRASINFFGGIAKAILQNEPTAENQLIYKAKQFIMEHCSEDISLEMVANSIYVSPVYLSRMFKEKTGQNFIDFLTEMRMQKAMKLLNDPKLKVYEVSDMVGYKSLKYFYKLFKHYSGLTPTEYRNQRDH